MRYFGDPRKQTYMTTYVSSRHGLLDNPHYLGEGWWRVGKKIESQEEENMKMAKELILYNFCRCRKEKKRKKQTNHLYENSQIF